MSDLVADMKFWCRHNKVTQTNLAELLNVTPQAVTEIFKGRNKPSGETVLLMLDVLTNHNRRKRRKSL
jgi:transcriptional regulator with XRE-family HTH domain